MPLPPKAICFRVRHPAARPLSELIRISRWRAQRSRSEKRSLGRHTDRRFPVEEHLVGLSLLLCWNATWCNRVNVECRSEYDVHCTSSTASSPHHSPDGAHSRFKVCLPAGEADIVLAASRPCVCLSVCHQLLVRHWRDFVGICVMVNRRSD